MDEKTDSAGTHPDPENKLQAIVSNALAGDFDAAVAGARLLTDKAVAMEAWSQLARINANSQRWDAAISALESALQHEPGSRPLRLQHALLLERHGRMSAALAELEQLEREAADTSQLLVHLARALQFAGRGIEAERKVDVALSRWPTDIPLHTLLAQLRWQHGAGDAATARLERAIEQFPRELQLRLVAADLLRNAGRPQRALRLLEEGLKLAPESVAFLTSIGVLLDGLDRPEAALPYLQAAMARAPGLAQSKRNLIPTLLRVATPAQALRLCEELSAQLPDDQQLIAYRATALRLRGDDEYRRLHDYRRLVRIYQPPPPPGFADIAAFNSALAYELGQLHRSAQRPLTQSLRGGSQTDGNLPADNSLVAGFFAMIDAPIRDYIARLGDSDPGHPTVRRRSAGYRIAGSWSVQLQPGGFHINHVHPQGWLSSAYYVELPSGFEAGSERAGWLKFGEPGVPLASCPPDHFVKPEPGMLVLFPSYMWHGTVPFTSGGRRLPAAFDVVPA